MGTEHELCSVFVGRTESEPRVNGTEVAEWRWISPGALDGEIALAPERFTPWLKMEWQRLREDFPARIAATAPAPRLR